MWKRDEKREKEEKNMWINDKPELVKKLRDTSNNDKMFKDEF